MRVCVECVTVLEQTKGKVLTRGFQGVAIAIVTKHRVKVNVKASVVLGLLGRWGGCEPC